MAKTRTVMKCNGKQRFTVVFHEDSAMNPYWLYRHFRGYDKYGYPSEKKRLVEKYADLSSCLYHVAQMV